MAELLQGDIAFQANLYESQNPTRRWLHNVRRKWIMDTIDGLLESIGNKEPRFLEIGIGCGIYTRFLAERGDVLAVDNNPAFVDIANGIPHAVGSNGDITMDSFGDAYHLALCSEVLEHVMDSPSALKNLYASISPGGKLVLTTPNAYSTVELGARLLSFKPIAALARRIYGEPVDGLGHINRMTHRQLRTQIWAAGFKVEQQADIGFYLPFVAEFGGNAGQRLCRWIAKKLARTPFAQLCWTQCWVLLKPKC